jgi:hypothetical protein
VSHFLAYASGDVGLTNLVAAVISFGNTRHTANQSYNFGNGSAIDGWFPRNATQLANLNQYADIMRDWCVSTDPICAANQTFYTEESHLGYYNVDSQSAASWIKSVASLTSTAPFTTAIPTSLSGTVQDYATLGTATPSGTVTLDTTWTSSASYTACTSTSYGLANSTTQITSTSSGSTATTASGSGSLTKSAASVFPLTGTSTQGAAVSPTVSSTSNTSGAPGSYGLVNGVEFVVMIGMIMSLAMIW